jgi:hypothetical protein
MQFFSEKLSARSRLRRLPVLPVATVLFLSSSGSVPLRAEEVLPSHLKLNQFPASVIAEVIVPNPGELFSLMDKLPGWTEWAAQVRKDFTLAPSNDRTELALLFGTMIADGFIAVQAEDAQAVREAGRKILDLAESLTLRQAVLPHCRAILEACEKRDWIKVRQELDFAHASVRSTMEKMRDEDLANYVSIAGWVRGTEILTSIIGQSYTEDRAEVLNQPDLAQHFIAQLSRLSQQPSHERLKPMLQGLKEVHELMVQKNGSALPSEAVLQIHNICAAIVKDITVD